MAKAMYESGYLTAAGYLIIIKGICVPDSVDLKIPSISSFCQEWGLPRSSFYRGISKLEKNGHGRLEPTGESVFFCQGLKRKSDKVKLKIETKKEVASPRSDCPESEIQCPESEIECPESEIDCPESETVAPENPHYEAVLESLKERQILIEDNISLSLDPDARAIEILSDPEYLHFKAVYDKAACVIKNPVVLAEIKAQYLGKWEGKEQTHTTPSEQVNLDLLEPDPETKQIVTQPLTLEEKINPIADTIPTVEINYQLAGKKADPFFPAKSTLLFKRDLAKNSTTIFPDVAQEDEFFEQYRHYLKATNPRLLPGQTEAIALAALKRINSSATNPGDRAILKLWKAGELKDFVGATYDAMASKLTGAKERIDRALNNRGHKSAF